jgi:hypothetical protein
MATMKERRDHVALAAWRIWTNNGNEMNELEREDVMKRAIAAANAEQGRHKTDVAWLEAILGRLRPR